MVPGSLACGSVVLPVTTMLPPSRASRSAMASPIPRLQPGANKAPPASVDMGAWYRAGSPAAEAQLRNRAIPPPTNHGSLMGIPEKRKVLRLGRAFAWRVLAQDDSAGNQPQLPTTTQFTAASGASLGCVTASI